MFEMREFVMRQRIDIGFRRIHGIDCFNEEKSEGNWSCTMLATFQT